MRVCLVSAFPPNHGNLAEYAEYLVDEIVENPEVDELVVLANRAENADGAVEGAGLAVRRVWATDSLFSLLVLPLRVLRMRPDVVHFNLHLMSWGRGRATNAVGALLPLLVRLLGFRVVVTLHNLGDTIDIDSIHGIRASWLNLLGMKLVTRFLAMVDEVVVTLRHYVPILKSRYRARNVSHVPHGCPTTNHNLVEGGGEVILSFGHFSEHKNLPLLIAAFREIRRGRPQARLVIAGDSHPNFPGYLERIRASTEPQENITFLGYVEEDCVESVFSDSTLVVLPYLTNTGAGGVFHLAMSHGKPVIMSDLPDFRRMLRDEGAKAVLVPPGDRGALAEAILGLLDDVGLQREMGKANLEVARSMTFNHVSHEYVGIYARHSPVPRAG